MHRFLLILSIISCLYADNALKRSTVYLDVMMTNKVDGELTFVDFNNGFLGSYSYTDDLDGNCVTLGWEIPIIDKEDKYKLLLGISYSIIPVEKNNMPFTFDNGIVWKIIIPKELEKISARGKK